MSRVNFEMDPKRKRELDRKIKLLGYHTQSEFWRAKARELLNNG